MTEDTTDTGEKWSKRQHGREIATGKTDGKKFKTCCLLCNKIPGSQSFCLFPMIRPHPA